MLMIMLPFLARVDANTSSATTEKRVRYPPEETEEKHRKILEEASRAFRAKGFAGISISDIMKATGLTHGPFYNHFASKNALIEDVIDQTAANTVKVFSEVAKEDGNTGIYRHYVSKSHRDEPETGCIFAACGPEISRDDSFRKVTAIHIEHHIQTLEAGLEASSRTSSRAEAVTQFATMVGAIVLSRMCADTPLSDEILQASLKELDRTTSTGLQN
jgi:TetR/AcrR family transcriptional repressor of nem operon